MGAKKMVKLMLSEVDTSLVPRPSSSLGLGTRLS